MTNLRPILTWRRFGKTSLVVLLALTVSPVRAVEDWPAWRGPRGDGTSLDRQVPLHWDDDSGRNIAWKVKAVGHGHGSPIVFGDSIFLASCDLQTHDRLLICLDASSGRIRWKRIVVNSELESKHALNSYASSTPATNGELIFVAFLKVEPSTIKAPNVSDQREIHPGKILVAAYDFQGHRKWLVEPGPFVSAHGFCSNPVLFEDLILINGDHDGDSWIAGLRQRTGEIVWKRRRPNGIRSYVTPIVRKINGRPQAILSGSQCVTGIDPSTGETIWQLDGPTEQFVASMVDDGQHFFLTAGYPTHHVMAIRQGGHGNVTDSHVTWHKTSARSYVPSPVVAGPYLFVADDRGTANCFRTSDGERLWQTRLGKHFHASLLAANGCVYFFAEDGVTKIVQPGDTLKIVAENKLNDIVFASPAVSMGRLIVRGEQHVYGIDAPAGSTNTPE